MKNNAISFADLFLPTLRRRHYPYNILTTCTDVKYSADETLVELLSIAELLFLVCKAERNNEFTFYSVVFMTATKIMIFLKEAQVAYFM